MPENSESALRMNSPSAAIRWGLKQANWYRRKKQEKQIKSWICRVPATILVVVSGVAPLLGGLWGADLTKLGYVGLLVGGGLFLTDRLFGFSKSWIRSIRTALLIEAEITLFEVSIAESQIDESAKLQSFVISINRIVMEETDAWIADLDQQTEDARQLASPGASAKAEG